MAAAGNALPAGRVTPLNLATSLEADAKKVLLLVQQLRKNASPTLTCELDDLETWAHLSQYFAGKLRAGVALHTYRTTADVSQQQRAIQLLNACVQSWKNVARIISGHYHEVPYIDDHSTSGSAYKDARMFSWSKYLPQVERDIELAKKKVK